MRVPHNEQLRREIIERMTVIRTRMPRDMDSLRHRAKQITDWRYYVTTFPLSTFCVAALTAYAIVPQRKPVRISRVDKSRFPIEPISKPSLIATGFNNVYPVIVRTASAWALGRMFDLIGLHQNSSEQNDSAGARAELNHQ